MPDPYEGAAAMSEEHTTAAVPHWLDALAGDAPAVPIIRTLDCRLPLPFGNL
jgi:hypothetical protein